MSDTSTIDIIKDKLDIVDVIQETDTLAPNNNNYSELNDIQTLLSAAAEWYHSKLTTEHRIFIKDTWGLSDETIDQYKIGYDPVGDKAELQRALNGGL